MFFAHSLRNPPNATNREEVEEDAAGENMIVDVDWETEKTQASIALLENYLATFQQPSQHQQSQKQSPVPALQVQEVFSRENDWDMHDYDGGGGGDGGPEDDSREQEKQPRQTPPPALPLRPPPPPRPPRPRPIPQTLAAISHEFKSILEKGDSSNEVERWLRNHVNPRVLYDILISGGYLTMQNPRLNIYHTIVKHRNFHPDTFDLELAALIGDEQVIENFLYTRVMTPTAKTMANVLKLDNLPLADFVFRNGGSLLLKTPAIFSELYKTSDEHGWETRLDFLFRRFRSPKTFFRFALVEAARNNQLPAMRVLLSYPPEFSMDKFALEEALEIASAKGFLQAADLLIAKGADINDSKALSYAIESKNRNTVTFLLDRGAIPEASHLIESNTTGRKYILKDLKKRATSAVVQQYENQVGGSSSSSLGNPRSSRDFINSRASFSGTRATTSSSSSSSTDRNGGNDDDQVQFYEISEILDEETTKTVAYVIGLSFCCCLYSHRFSRLG